MVTKRVSSKLASYISKPNQQQQNQDRSQQVDEKVIADMAKGFLQAQANVNNTSCTVNSQEVVDLLNKINYQLTSLQGALNVSNNSGGQASQSSQPTGESQQLQESQNQQGGQQAEDLQSENDVSQELRTLFSMLLNNNNKQNNQTNSNQGTNNNSTQNQRQGQVNGQNNRQNSNSIAVQTAAQALAQAQYELSNELEASLTKLKQVISESEKIANKISSLLGEENSQSQ
ncbi:hypothetical protein SRRS_25790 [Sporomusa rhizae]